MELHRIILELVPTHTGFSLYFFGILLAMCISLAFAYGSPLTIVYCSLPRFHFGQLARYGICCRSLGI